MQITDLPFSLYSTFVIEARHGFNKVRLLFISPYCFYLLLFPGFMVLYFGNYFHFAGTVMKLFFVPLTFYPIFADY